MPTWPKELKTPVLPTSPQLMIPNDSNNSIFSVAFNSLYNYNSEQANNSHNINNANNLNQQSQASSTSSTVARSNSSTALDLENEKKQNRKDLEYK
jgi:hypothetical protein